MKKTLEIRLEIPGNAVYKVLNDIEDGETKIKVSETKKYDKIPKSPNENIVNLKEFSYFEVVIPLPAEKYRIKHNPKFVHEICIIQYELSEKAEEVNSRK